MRTVSFSDPKIRNVFNNRFVNTFTNTQGDPTSGKSIKHRPNESPGACIRGNGKQNVQTIFLTPDGNIFHVATGYQSSDDLLEEAKFALGLFDQLQSSPGSERATLVVNTHKTRLDAPQNQRGTFSEFDKQLSRFAPARIANRSGSPTGNTLPGSNMMRRFTQMGVDADQKFSIDSPLMNYRELERDPTKLVGDGDSFFASSSSSNLFSK